MAILDRLADNAGRRFALLPARLSLGSTMLYHGGSKLNRKGLEHTVQFFESLGIAPARPWALATGISELLAGFLAVTGIATRPAALAVIATQAVAIARVHGKKGFSNLQGGFEFNLALIAIAASLLLGGPGAPAAKHPVHRRLARRRRPWTRARPPRLLAALQ